MYASCVDKKGERTMGIITQPDTLKKRCSEEEDWVELARNEDVNSMLGWYVLVKKWRAMPAATRVNGVTQQEERSIAHERFDGLKD